MLLSIQQKYILEVLRKLREQLQAQLQGKFSEINISAQRMEAMLRQLRCGCQRQRENVDFRRNRMSFFGGQHSGVYSPYTQSHLLA